MKLAFSIRRFTATCATVAILACGVLNVQAQNISDAHLRAAKKAIAVIHATDQFDEFLPATSRDLKDELVRKDPNLDALISQTVDEQALALVKRRADLETEAARAYAKHFTQKELEQISTFYDSDTGKKLLSEGPLAVRDILSAYDVWRQAIAQDLAVNVGKALANKVNTSASVAKESATKVPAAQK